jgi:hypothetical protein
MILKTLEISGQKKYIKDFYMRENFFEQIKNLTMNFGPQHPAAHVF